MIVSDYLDYATFIANAEALRVLEIAEDRDMPEIPDPKAVFGWAPCSQCCRGWDVFDVNREPDREVERCDSCNRFADDDAALDYVLRRVFLTVDGCTDDKCGVCRLRAGGMEPSETNPDGTEER